MTRLGRVRVACLVLVAHLLAAPDPVSAERLPAHRYTIADGLAGDIVNRIVQDSRGFLWICTDTGLSRFDGTTFRSYGTDDGLPHPVVNDFVEASDGTLWVATSGGLARLKPSRESGEAAFESFSLGTEAQTDYVTRLYEDRHQRLWIATGARVHVLEKNAERPLFRKVSLAPHLPDKYPMDIAAFAEDAGGSLWIASNWGLVRRLPSGVLISYPLGADGRAFAYGLLIDRHQRLWIRWGIQAAPTGRLATGFTLFRPEPADRTGLVARPPIAQDRASSNLDDLSKPLEAGGARAVALPGGGGVGAGAIVDGRDGRVWMVSAAGLLAIDGSRTTRWDERAGVPFSSVKVMAEDRDGNLWLGTDGSGLFKVARLGFRTYTAADGLGKGWIISFSESAGGPLHVTTRDPRGRFLSRWDGTRFMTVRIPLPSSIPSHALGWGWNQFIVQDRERGWWVPTAVGLFRYRSTMGHEELARATPITKYTSADGIPSGEIFRLYQDRRGDLWLGVFNQKSPLARWDRSTDRFHAYTAADGFPADTATAFAEDRAGNLWIGLYYHGLVRYRAGRFEHFTEADGVPRHLINDLHVDGAGRLWIAASRDGLARVDDPNAAHPRFASYTTSDGLASNGVTCLTEDTRGRIYVGTRRGINRLDPATGRIEHFTTMDGLANNNVLVAHRDQRGQVWFGTYDGLSRLEPDDQAAPSSPSVLITGLRVAGEPHPVPEVGRRSIGELKLRPTVRQVEVDFVGISFAPGELLRYQHRLLGSSDRWSPPASDRTVRFVSLGPGRYQFEVRAMTSPGTMSLTPAIVAFSIPPPFWLRWWFLVFFALTVAAVIYAIHRARLSRIVALERVRTRIATDLHDDIGSGLSQVAMLTELLDRRVGSDSRIAEPLATIGEVSRDLIDSMNDIVWAINPLRDHVSDLSHRMRRFASEVLGARDIEPHFALPDERRDVALGPDVRREVWLIFKEAVHNVARHAACTRADIRLAVRHDSLELSIRDNGRGFDPESAGDGNGLANMRQRAARLEGTLDVTSEKGHGTAVTLHAPLRRRRSWGVVG